MQPMTLYLRAGDVVLHCAGCVRDFYIDPHKPFVPQLRSVSYDHHCYSSTDVDDTRTVLASMTAEHPQAG